MHPHWLLIIPPLLTIALAIYSRRVVLALLVGCLAAAFIISDYSLWNSLAFFGRNLLKTTQLDQWTSWSGIWNAQNPQVSLFVIFMGILIRTIEKVGGYKAFILAIERFVHRKQDAELAAVALSHCVSIDGYLATLTVGSVMRPLIDKFDSTRVKLAYIARSVAIPVCSINPLSTWMALILLQLNVAKIHAAQGEGTLIIANTISVYFSMIPFMFYSLLTAFSVWLVVSKQFSFGAIGALENSKTQHIPAQKDESIFPSGFTPNISDFFLPLIFLVTFTFIGFYLTDKCAFFAKDISCIHSQEHIDVAPSLLYASIAAVIIYFIYMYLRGAIVLKDTWKLSKDGFLMMIPSVAILNLAWTFGAIETQSGTVASLIEHLTPKGVLPIWLPMVFFLSACGIALATGSSWATIALMFPLVVTTSVSIHGAAAPIEIGDLPLLIPTLGAVVSGAVAGDQLSPIADSSIVVCASSQCPHGDHAYAQFTYGIPILFFTAAAYALSGWLVAWGSWIGILAPLFITGAMITAYFYLRQQHMYMSLATKT
ncbi:MAG: Na+/H+ antiporter NhaC family protein [Parachlamydiales bacterium]|jgi:Na+/H+ antiporter NhaC